MATGPPSSGPPPIQVLEQEPPTATISWDGDRMFNIYIYDYCIKRGYTKTAEQFMAEAEIPAESQPPINAKQGLLFEWWSVFWVLFTAKSSGSGSDDALLYTQHQTHQTSQRSGTRPQQQQAPARLGGVNGVRPGGSHASMPNGLATATFQPGQLPMPNGSQGGAFAGPPQPNGVVGPSHSVGPSIGTPAMMSAQRPSAVPPRGPNGPPFHSPAMAHSPQHGGGGQPGPQQPPMGGNMAPQGSMPQMRGSMPPPAHHGMMPNSQPPPPYQPLQGSSASHPNSPAAHGVTQSPSFAHRQPQMQPGPNRPGHEIRQLNESSTNADLFRIDASQLVTLKEELGLAGVDLPSMTADDKSRLVALARDRGAVKPSVPSNLPTVMPNRMQQMQPMQPVQPRQLGPPFAQQGQNQPQRSKRNSTSPGDENEQGQNDTSPPANKRPRPSPDHQQPPMAGLVYPQQQAMQGTSGGPQPPGVMQMMGGANGFPSARMVNPQMSGPHMNLNNQMNQYHQSMVASHKNNLPAGVLNMIPPNAPSIASADSLFPTPTDGSQSRPGTGPFPGNRGPQTQNKPMSMMPPPSPSAKVKEEGGSGGNVSSVHSSPHNLPATTGGHGPQSQAPVGTGPPTPAQSTSGIMAPSPSAAMSNGPTPGSQGQPGSQSQSNTQPPHPSASAPPTTSNPNDIFIGNDLMQTLTSFEPFDSSSLFHADQMGAGTDLDFGEWFNTDSL